MPYTPTIWTDEELAGSERYTIADNAGTPINTNVQISISTPVTVAGTPVTAATMNNIEDALADHDERIITLEAGGTSGGVTDGDKGDITVSASGATWTIDNEAVTLAKMANMATASLLGRNTAETGVPEILSASTVRTLLALVVGTNVQAYNANLTTYAGITPSANVQSLLSSADYAAMRTLLGLVIGTNVQAYDSALTTWAGKTAPSGTVLGTTDAQTLTNKRITKRVATTTDDATAVIDSDSYDEYYLTAIANATEISITGTPTQGQTIFIGLKDAGVSKALTWTGITGLGQTLPTATIAGKQHIIGIKYIAAAWRAIAVGVEA